MIEKFNVGDLIIYQNGNRYEVGKIKRLTEDGAFVWFSTGETAAKTPFDAMNRIENAYAITGTKLGGVDARRAKEMDALTEKDEARKQVMIHGAMVYGCKDCGSRWIMYLEKGLEEPGCEDRKPVPFGIRCPFCSGFHGFDISGYLELPSRSYEALPENSSYFANKKGSDCGTPVISPAMRKLRDDELPSVRILKMEREVKRK